MLVATAHGWIWGALFTVLLLAVCYTDVRWRRIPNALVLVILIAGIASSISAQPLRTAIAFSAEGFGLGLAIWIGFWLLRLIGAGDVKFFAAAGAWLGPGGTWRAALIGALAGGVLAVVFLVRQRRLRQGIERTALAIHAKSVAVLSPDADAAMKRQNLPYGVALAFGVLIATWTRILK